VDKTTKLLLLLIAAGLWVNALPNLAGRASAQSHAQSDVCLGTNECLASINGWISDADRHLQTMASDLHWLITAMQDFERHRASQPPPAPAPVRPRPPAPPPRPSGPCLTGAC
jgi:hypothetical protein